MTYTPTAWVTGDTITAALLNKMESGIADAQFVSKSVSQLFSESVTTEAGGMGYFAQLEYSSLISASSITVVFDGTSYSCERMDDEETGGYIYGGFGQNGIDFTDYPFVIMTSEYDGNFVITQTSGTHAIAASVVSISIDADLTAAIIGLASQSPDVSLRLLDGITTHDEIDEAFSEYRLMHFYANGYRYVTDYDGTNISFFPTSSSFTVGFDQNGYFHVVTI